MTEITLGLRITADGTAVITTAKQTTAAIEGVGKAAANVNSQGAAGATAAAAQSTKAAQATVAATEQATQSFMRLSTTGRASFQQIGVATAASQKALERMGKAANDTGEKVKRSADEGGRAAKRYVGELEVLGSRLGDLEKSALGGFRTLAGLFIVDKVVQFGKAAIDTAARYQALETRLKSLTGSTDAYAEATEFLNRTAQRQGVLFEVITEGYSKLLPLVQSGILTTAQARAIQQGYNDAAAETGATATQLGQSMFGMAQGFAASTLRAEELNQTTEPIIGLLQKLDKAAGLPAGGFRKLVVEGKVTSAFFRETLIKALQEYDGAAAKAADNIAQSFTRLENTWNRFMSNVGRPLAGLVAGGLDILLSPLAGDGTKQKSKARGAAEDEARAETLRDQLQRFPGEFPLALGDRAGAEAELRQIEQRLAIAKEEAQRLRQSEQARQGASDRGALRTPADDAVKEATAGAEAKAKLTKAEKDLQAAIDAGLDSNGKYAAALGQVRFQLDNLKDPVADQLKGLRDETGLLGEVGVGRAKAEALLKAEQAVISRGIPLSAEERTAVLAAADARYRKAQSLQTEAEALDKLDAAAKAELANMLDAERARKQVIIDRDQALRDRTRSVGEDLLGVRENRARREGDGATIYDIEVERAKRWKEETLKGLDQAAAGYQDFADKVEQVFEGQVNQAFLDAEDASSNWQDGLKRGFRDLKSTTGDWASFTAGSIRTAFEIGEDIFVKFARTGKLTMADLGRFIQETLARAFYRNSVGNGIEQFGSAFFNAVSSAFGNSPTASGAGSTANVGFTTSSVWHEGGRVGDPAPQRLVPAHVFEGAPRHHSGASRIGADERPAILKVGERVLTEGQAAAMDRGGVSIQIIDQRKSGQAVEAEESTGPDGRRMIRMMIRDEVGQDLRRNGQVAQSLQGEFGAKRAATVRG